MGSGAVPLKIFERADDTRPLALRLVCVITGVLVVVTMLEIAILDQAGVSWEALRLTAGVLAVAAIVVPLALVVDAVLLWPIMKRFTHYNE